VKREVRSEKREKSIHRRRREEEKKRRRKINVKKTTFFKYIIDFSDLSISNGMKVHFVILDIILFHAIIIVLLLLQVARCNHLVHVRKGRWDGRGGEGSADRAGSGREGLEIALITDWSALLEIKARSNSLHFFSTSSSNWGASLGGEF